MVLRYDTCIHIYIIVKSLCSYLLEKIIYIQHNTMNFHFPRSCTAWSLRQGIALVLPGPHDTDGIIPSGSEGPRKKWQWGHGEWKKKPTYLWIHQTAQALSHLDGGFKILSLMVDISDTDLLLCQTQGTTVSPVLGYLIVDPAVCIEE